MIDLDVFEGIQRQIRRNKNNIETERSYEPAAPSGGELLLSANCSATDTTITVQNIPTGIGSDLGWIVIDYYTIECEVIKIASVSGNTITLEDGLTYAHSSGNPCAIITSEPVSAKWFGALGDDSNADAIPLSRGAIQACRVGKAYHIPAGTYRADIEDVSPIIGVTAPIHVYGDGKGQTIIKILPDETPSGTYYGVLFSVPNTNEKGVLRDLTLYGPSTYIGEVDAVAVSGGDTTNLGDVDIINVHVDNFPKYGVQIGTGRRTVTIMNCELQAYEGILHHSSNPTYENHLHVYNTRFVEAKCSSGLSHFLYINPGVSWIFKDCYFGIMPSTGGYVFHIYGSGGGDGISPKYNIIEGCYFSAGLQSTTYGAILGARWIPITIKDSVFKGCPKGAIMGEEGGLVMQNCQLEIEVEDGSIVTSRSGDVHISDCTFINPDQAYYQYIKLDNLRSIEGRATISNCIFDGAYLTTETSAGDLSVAITNNYFDFSGVTYNYPAAIILDVVYGIITGSLFIGNDNGEYAGGAVSWTTSGTPTSVIVRGNTFINWYQNISANGSFVWNASDNYFNVDRMGNAASTKARIMPMVGTKPDAIASASTLVLSWFYDTYHISGTTNIGTIYLVNTDNTNLADGAIVRLIADGAWSLGSGGNIVPLHTGARVANSVAHLVYDATNTKWYEITPFQQQSKITDELITITYTAPGTPDYAIQNLTNSSPYGFVTQDEGNSVLKVVANLQARVNELETVLVLTGLLSSNKAFAREKDGVTVGESANVSIP